MTKALYLPLLESRCKDGVEITRNMAYGPHPRQILDVYKPSGAKRAGVIAFVHGGAFVRGTKDINNEMYGNVLTWFALQGFVGVNVEYRLAPESPYPGGAQDIALACKWIATSIAQFGGDAKRLCLIGHSAGGTHVGTLISEPAFSQDHGASCAVLVSARLRADTVKINPNAHGVEAYFGQERSLYNARSPVTHAASVSIPVLIANAEFENPLLDLYGLEFALALGRARGVAPLHLTLQDHNHVSIMAHFNTEETFLGEQIISFFEHAI